LIPEHGLKNLPADNIGVGWTQDTASSIAAPSSPDCPAVQIPSLSEAAAGAPAPHQKTTSSSHPFWHSGPYYVAPALSSSLPLSSQAQKYTFPSRIDLSLRIPHCNPWSKVVSVCQPLIAERVVMVVTAHMVNDRLVGRIRLER
jgi:hypothetical protein